MMRVSLIAIALAVSTPAFAQTVIEAEPVIEANPLQSPQSPRGLSRLQLPTIEQPLAAVTVSNIDVCSVATARARAKMGSTFDARNQFVTNAIASANKTLTNSAINNVKFRKKGNLVSVSYPDQSFDAVTILFHTVTVDGFLDGLPGNMQSRECDVTVLFAISSDNVAGIAFVAPSPDAAFAVVHPNAAIKRLTFAHELGHLAGFRHDIANDPNLVPFPAGHGYRNCNVGTLPSDVMAVRCAGGTRFPDYSNANRGPTHGSPVWGNIDTAHIVPLYRSSGPIVATNSDRW